MARLALAGDRATRVVGAGVRPVALGFALGLLAVGGAGCRRATAPPDEAPAAQVEPAPAVAALSRPSVAAGDVTVELVRVQRLEKDLVQAELLATNAGQVPVDLDRLISSTAGGLPQAAFTHESGDIRTFVLHDAQEVPQCSTALGPVAPGGRSAFFVRFAALSDAQYQGTIEIPGLPPLAGVTVPAAPGP